jgi:hypothetical protein
MLYDVLKRKTARKARRFSWCHRILPRKSSLEAIFKIS